jgi:hypothetical protein
MSLEQLTIVIRFDFDDPDGAKLKIMQDTARMQAKALLTTALLLADKRKPQIMLQGGNLFEGEEIISLADDVAAESIINDEQR